MRTESDELTLSSLSILPLHWELFPGTYWRRSSRPAISPSEQLTGHAKHSLLNDHSCSGSDRATDLKEIIATNLRRKRRDQQMTQEELAERAGLSTRYVGAIERGDVSASVTVLGQIAEALGVEPGDLLRRRSSRKG